MLRSGVAVAAEWNKRGFEARGVTEALAAINAAGAVPSKGIQLIVPDIAADGRDVLVFVVSKIANTQMISVIVEGNTTPLAFTVNLLKGVEPTVSIRVKIRKTCKVRVVVQAAGQTHWVAKEVKVANA